MIKPISNSRDGWRPPSMALATTVHDPNGDPS